MQEKKMEQTPKTGSETGPETGRVISSSEDLRLQLRVCLDTQSFIKDARTLFGIDLSEGNLVQRYLEEPQLRSISPNPAFDELYYRRKYADVAQSIANGVFPSGLVHFLKNGFAEGRMPSRAFEMLAAGQRRWGDPIKDGELAQELIAMEPNCSEFAKWFRFLSPLDIYNNLGRRVLPAMKAGRVRFELLAEPEFDAEFYLSQFPARERRKITDPFQHYLTEGCGQGLSPNARFDERFYISFYDDVRLAIAAGQVRCGFHHYLAAGRNETRIGRYDLAQALENRFYGITQKVGVRRVDELEKKLRPPVGEFTAQSDRRFNVVMPDLNPDLFFGGYKSAVEFIACLTERGHRVRVIKSESPYEGKDYFMYHFDGQRLGQAFREVEVISAHSTVATGEGDSYMCYSTWDAYVARSLAGLSGSERFVMFAQEFEPIFHSQNSHRFLCENAYRFDHFPVFNSQMLVDFFRMNRLGIFARDPDSTAYSVFEHVLAPPAKAPKTAKGGKAAQPDADGFSLFVYARPESHAERNLFEVVILALRAALRRRPPTAKWNFFGLGAIGADARINISPAHYLEIRSRLPYDEYAARMASVNVGISLMYAPHPSVVPFELAQNGALVVTNTYSNRSAEQLMSISPNLVPVEQDFDSIVDAIVATMERVENGERGTRAKIKDRPQSWSEAFAPVFDALEKEGFL